MIKMTLGALTLLLLSSVSLAAPTPLEMTARLGVNFIQIKEDPPRARPDSAQMGNLIGFGARYRFSELTSIETALEWNARKQGKKITVSLTPYQISVSSHELSVPVLFRYGGVYGFSMAVGAYFSKLVGDLSWSVNPDPSAADLASDSELKPDLTSISSGSYGWGESDFGWMGRLGYQFEIGQALYLNIEVGYRAGLKDLNNVPASTVIRNSTGFEVTTGVTLPI